jgi:hypothetical protein
MLKWIVGVVAASLLLLGAPASAEEEAPSVGCPAGQERHPVTGECVLIVTDPGDGGGDGDPGNGGDPDDGGNENVTNPRCEWAGEEIPCTDPDQGYWSNDLLCYISLSPVEYPPNDPMWQGHYPEGAIYLCYNPFIALGTRGYEFWSAAPPDGPDAPPDPRDIAQQAIATMQLRAVRIGIVPEDLPGRVGVIGLPTWMWAENPDQHTWGPITRTATAGAYSVTATAETAKVVWDMGDGVSVTCNGPGTPYADSYGKRQSPDCGHVYTRDGRYPITATSYWTVRWNGIGQSGTIPLQFSDSTAITMGEVQVIVQ